VPSVEEQRREKGGMKVESVSVCVTKHTQEPFGDDRPGEKAGRLGELKHSARKQRRLEAQGNLLSCHSEQSSFEDTNANL
jgi:hypothetical protein